MLIPPEAEPDQWIGNAFQPVSQHQKTGQGGDYRAETVFRGGVHRCQQCATDRAFTAFCESAANGRKTKHQDHQNPHQQGRFHGPDGGQFGDFSLYRRGHPRQGQGMSLAVPLGDPPGEQQVHYPDQQQRR
jgi:hypothetical protein